MADVEEGLLRHPCSWAMAASCGARFLDDTPTIQEDASPPARLLTQRPGMLMPYVSN
jgi:hypothetical protein